MAGANGDGICYAANGSGEAGISSTDDVEEREPVDEVAEGRAAGNITYVGSNLVCDDRFVGEDVSTERPEVWGIDHLQDCGGKRVRTTEIYLP